MRPPPGIIFASVRPRCYALLLCACLVGACASGKSKGGSGPAKAGPETLYDRIGGVDQLRILVDEWMLEITSDERIRDFFVEVDIGELKLRLVERLCVLVEGPCLYQGQALYEAHADLRLAERHLRAFLEGLEPALQRSGMEEGPAEELRERITGLAAELAVATGL